MEFCACRQNMLQKNRNKNINLHLIMNISVLFSIVII